jgi:hypothetical protein
MSVHSMVQSAVFLCFSSEQQQLGQDMTPVRVYTPVHQVTGSRLLLYPDTATLSPSSEVTASGMLFQGNVQFLNADIDEFDSRLSKEAVKTHEDGDVIAVGTIYTAIVLGNESCSSVDLSSDVTESTGSGTIQTVSIPGVRRPLESILIQVDKVLLPSRRLLGSEEVGATLCVALNAVSPTSFVPIHTFARCSVSEEDPQGAATCSHRGTCSVSTSECTCEKWFGGANCQLVCPVGYAGEACSGNGVCMVNGTCSCMRNPPKKDAEVQMEWHGSACHVPVRRMTLTNTALKAPQLFRLRYSDIISDWDGDLIGRIDGSVLPSWLDQLGSWNSNPDNRPIMQLLVVVPSTADEARLSVHIGSNRLLTQKAALWSGSSAFSYTDISLTSGVLSELGVSGSRSIQASTIHGYGRWGILTVDLGAVLSTYVALPGILDGVTGVTEKDSVEKKVRALMPTIQSELFVSCSMHSGVGSQSARIKGASSVGVLLHTFQNLLQVLNDFASAQHVSNDGASTAAGTSTSALTGLENLGLQVLTQSGYVNTARVINIEVSNEMRASLSSLDTFILGFASIVVAFAMTYGILEYLGYADRGLMARVLCCCCKGKHRAAYLEQDY